ncbi:MAG: bifunctional phosphoglucose/phosphomannose isomerase [Chloroflexota bacterium]
MNLDDLELFAKIDSQNMLWHIEHLPEQLEAGWELGMKLPLPNFPRLRMIVIAGVGGSAIGADLVRYYVSHYCKIPVIVFRDYDLPAWAHGEDTLVIASSHSGNTEEVLDTLDTARMNRCSILTISTGGELSRRALEMGVPLWKYDYVGQPRTAVGYSFNLLLAIFTRLNILPDPFQDIEDAVTAMREFQEELSPSNPTVHNLAKRMAGQLVGRWVSIYGAGFLAPVARRWKGQINENAKAWAQYEFLPEADHNTLAGTQHPEQLLTHIAALFLRSKFVHPRHQLRIEMTKRAFMLQGIGTDFIDARGDTPLAHLWTTLLLGDYIAYYLAMAYQIDPTPVIALEEFKRELAASRVLKT